VCSTWSNSYKRCSQREDTLSGSLTLTVLSGWVKSMAARDMLVSGVLNRFFGSLMYRIRPCPKYRSWGRVVLV
jgi:hypothetical protein